MITAPTIRWLWLLPEARQALETRELAVILRCYRKLTGLSQAAMGELLGYDPSYVSLSERRQRTISDRQGLSPISRVLAIPAHALGITAEEDADLPCCAPVRGVDRAARGDRPEGRTRC